jgi:hypothetical protein
VQRQRAKAFTIMTNLQRLSVKHNTGFLLFLANIGGFSRPFRGAM